MMVRPERHGISVIGLHIGIENDRQFFPADRDCVDLEFGDLGISCRLHPEFWCDRPSILDPRLGVWLEAKRQRRASGTREIVLALTPVRRGVFRLHVLPIPSTGKRIQRLDS